jgi:hypothetical protein
MSALTHIGPLSPTLAGPDFGSQETVDFNPCHTFQQPAEQLTPGGLGGNSPALQSRWIGQEAGKLAQPIRAGMPAFTPLRLSLAKAIRSHALTPDELIPWVLTLPGSLVPCGFNVLYPEFTTGSLQDCCKKRCRKYGNPKLRVERPFSRQLL